MTLDQLTKQLKKDTNGSLAAVRCAALVHAGLITYSEALAECNPNVAYSRTNGGAV